MFSNRLAFAALAVACVAAAAGGGYLATRQSAPAAEPAPSAVEAAPQAAAKTAAQPVEETEAVVGGTMPAPKPAAGKETASRVPPTPAGARQVSREPAPRTRPRAPSDNGSAREIANTQAPAGPSNAAPPAPVVSAPIESSPATVEAEPRPLEPRAPEPPAKVVQELVVSAESVIGLQTEGAISSERARVEDRVEARVVRDVRVDGDVAIPAGSRAIGEVTLVERGGKFKERARLGIRFHTLVLADGTRLPMTTETIYRYGDAPGNSSAAKIGGGAVAGAILGAILGGAKGAAVGASTGAAGGTAAVAAGGRSEAEIPANSEVTARILSPVTVTVER
jgi:hypothetical protein